MVWQGLRQIFATHELDVTACILPANVDNLYWTHLFLHTVVRTPSINAQCRSMPINADQIHGIDLKCLSMPIIERTWSTLGSMPEFWSALIGIRHWSGESWVVESCKTLFHPSKFYIDTFSPFKMVYYYRLRVSYTTLPGSFVGPEGGLQYPYTIYYFCLLVLIEKFLFQGKFIKLIINDCCHLFYFSFLILFEWSKDSK